MLLYYSNIDGHYNQKLYIKLVISDVSIDQTGATALLAVPSGPQLSAIYIYIKLLMNIIYLLLTRSRQGLLERDCFFSAV